MALHGTGFVAGAAIGLPTRPRPVPGGLTTPGAAIREYGRCGVPPVFLGAPERRFRIDGVCPYLAYALSVCVFETLTQAGDRRGCPLPLTARRRHPFVIQRPGDTTERRRSVRVHAVDDGGD